MQIGYQTLQIWCPVHWVLIVLCQTNIMMASLRHNHSALSLTSTSVWKVNLYILPKFCLAAPLCRLNLRQTSHCWMTLAVAWSFYPATYLLISAWASAVLRVNISHSIMLRRSEPSYIFDKLHDTEFLSASLLGLSAHNSFTRGYFYFFYNDKVTASKF